MVNIKLSQNPIFIVGFPRSGTTLLQSLLITQSNFYSFPETHFFCTISRFIEIDERGYVNPKCLDLVKRKIFEKINHKFSTIAEKNIFILADKNILTVKIIFEYLIIDLLSKQIEEKKIPTIHWLEKTPGHIFHIETIQSYYPNAKFIEIIRNPLNSIYSSKVNFENLNSGEESNQISPSMLANRWKDGFHLYNRLMNRYPKNLYTVKYENLIKNVNYEFSKIANYLNFEPDLNKLKSIKSASKSIVLDREIWKKKNLQENIITSQKNYQWQWKEKLKLNYLLKDELLSLGYVNQISYIQYIYNGCMNLIYSLTKVGFLNQLKRRGKYFLKKLDLWPYLK